MIFVIKKDEILLFLRDLDINPRLEISGFPTLIFCDNSLDDKRFLKFFGKDWGELIDRYNYAMDILNNEIFDPIFMQILKSGLVGEDIIISANQQICTEVNKITKEYGSFEEYIAKLMLNKGE